jgi:carboxypeptidase family protein/TonB-dependent receptor-like protein
MKIVAVVVALSFSLFAAIPIHAQVTGATISGTVTDASGAAIPGAQVSIKNTATGITRDTPTDSDGFYTVPNLPAGNYEVRVSAKGFSTAVQSNITLGVGAQQQLNMAMKVGETSQTVEVTGEAPQVELTSSALTAEVNETTVRELPLNGRDWSSLAVLEPGVIGIRSQLGTTGSVNRGNRGFGNQLATDGHRPSENTYRINGINVNDYSNGSPGSVEGKQLGVDGIQEFSVVTTNYAAEYGRTSGAVVNAVLKAGTNGFHGDVYWFLRDEGLDAKNFFDTSKVIAPFHRNQFGGSAGGPIIKNKTFFFADYEGVRQAKSLTSRDTVPSVAARGGLLCSLCAKTQQLPNNPSDPNGTTNGVDNVVAKYLPLYPSPDPALGSDATGNFGFVVTNPLQVYTEDYVTARVDHKFSDKDSLDGFYFHDKSPQSTPDAFLLSTTTTLSSRQMVGLEETHIFSPSLVNTFRAGYNRSVGGVGVPGASINAIAGDTTLGVGSGRVAPIIQINGGITLMQGSLGSQARYNHILNSFQYNDDAFLTRGLHSIKFGGFAERLQGHEFTLQRPNGSFVFNDLQSFLTNVPLTLNSIGSTAIASPYGERITFFGGYVQDDWRFRPNLTLNLGVRYEAATLPTEIHNLFSVIQNINGGPRVSVTHPWQTNPTLKNFAPRVGFAWDPFKNGKTSVRGGFGIFDVLPGTWVGLNQETGSYPFALTLNSGALPPYSFATPAANSIGANQANPTAATIANAQAWAPDQNPENNYAMNWNFNVQRQITPTLTATVGYVGMHTVHSPFTTDQSNMALPISGTNMWPVTKGTIIDPNVGALRPTFWMVSSHYNGVQAQLTKRMSHGLQASASYTYGKCYDDTSSGLIGDPFQNSYTTTMFFLDASRRGLCDFNINNNFVANFIWNVPGPKSGMLSHIAGGWQTGAILTASSGIPTSPFIGGDPLGLINADAADYPDYVPGCDPVNHSWRSNVSGSSYINPSCYTVPVAAASVATDPTKCLPYPAPPSGATYTIPANSCQQLFGNAGRNSITGPPSFDLDFSIFKNFAVPRISESFNVQFRAELFNVLNHPNFLLPNFNEGNNQVFSGTGAPTPTVIDNSGTYDPRQIQFGLKVIW